MEVNQLERTEGQGPANRSRTPRVRSMTSSHMLLDVRLRVRDKAPDGEHCVVTLEKDHIGLQNCHIVDVKLAKENDIVSDIPHHPTYLFTRLYSWIVSIIHGATSIANSTSIAAEISY
jgi:hypothetical protein